MIPSKVLSYESTFESTKVLSYFRTFVVVLPYFRTSVGPSIYISVLSYEGSFEL